MRRRLATYLETAHGEVDDFGDHLVGSEWQVRTKEVFWNGGIECRAR